MKRINEAGFTVIETMLFLAITGLMMMSVIVGSNSSINRQRYYDSVNTLKSFIQQQYSDTANTIHQTTATFSCNSAGVLTDTGSSITSGQSDCVILGKYIITPDTKHLDVYDVVGTTPSVSVAGLDDTTIFIKNNGALLPNGYGTYISSAKTTYTIDWGASLADTATPQNGILFSMAILRSPLSGNIVTFYNQTVSPAAPASIASIISTTNAAAAAKFCVKSEDLLASGGMAIGILAGASNASGVSAIGQGTSGCP